MLTKAVTFNQGDIISTTQTQCAPERNLSKKPHGVMCEMVKRSV